MEDIDPGLSKELRSFLDIIELQLEDALEEEDLVVCAKIILGTRRFIEGAI